MTDHMQAAVEVLALALFDMKNTVNVFGPWEADVSNIIRTTFRDKAATILAEIAPLIRAEEREDADRAYSLVEKAFKDGLRYANSVNVLDDADMDQAWQWSQVRAAAIRNRGNE